MQGTVRRFDAATASGSVLLDDGRELTFDEAAFAGSNLLHLRPGQRVRLRVDHDDATRVRALTLVTFSEPD